MNRISDNGKIKYYLLMHAALVFLSFSGVFAKFAAESEWFSIKWFVLYGLMLVVLCVYALAWQQILKGLPLTVAFSNKAVGLFWGIIWGALIFGEEITLKKILAALIIFVGVYIISTDREEAEKKEGDYK